MRAVIQRVQSADINIENAVVGSIDAGILVLVAFEESDGSKEMEYILNKVINLRIFEDEEGKMNLSVKDINGGILIAPNFTLYGDARKGMRPGYSSGASPVIADKMYDEFMILAKKMFSEEKLGFGHFQADMKISLVNDGPVTILLDSAKVF